ncbi:unnamed protein product [Rhizophagus irregularis]|nr:unnamed protein product [Rhizophagus irregularis]
MEIDNRFIVLRTIFIKGKGIVKLENNFFKGLDCDEDTIYLYTDASKKENKNSIGWVKINTSNLKVLDKEYLRISNNFDVIELELMAIFIVKSHSNDKGNDMADALSKMGSHENNDNSENLLI